ncbi:MAG: ABC transporter substrate-binding protein [Thermoproteota archaeon]|nr:ABC transporter substrate-binding protein [Thermoproteota archaeon]
MVTRIRVGHTPDSDDAFMFYGLEKGLIPTGDFVIEHVIEDIENLNKRALQHELEVTAISAHAYAYLQDYSILNSGGSFGLNYGPIIISNKENTIDNIREKVIGIPGTMTSAYLLMTIALGKLNFKEMLFSEIPNAVVNGDVDYGLVIHESQITYPAFNLNKVFDLGEWWHNQSNGLPVPLGINVASQRLLASDKIYDFDKLLQKSIQYGLEHLDDAIEHSSKYARGTSKPTLAKFVRMYVNDFTVEMKKEGKKSIAKLFEFARLKGIINNNIDIKYSY